MNRLKCLPKAYYRAAKWPEYAFPLVDLGIKLFLARVFFLSGMTKVSDWEGTLYLFNEVYTVPVLSPEVAAWMATAGELGLSVFLVLGFMERFALAGLFILNLVAATSFPDLSEAGRYQHLCWGLLIILLLTAQGKKWGLDGWIERRYFS